MRRIVSRAPVPGLVVAAENAKTERTRNDDTHLTTEFRRTEPHQAREKAEIPQDFAALRHREPT